MPIATRCSESSSTPSSHFCTLGSRTEQNTCQTSTSKVKHPAAVGEIIQSCIIRVDRCITEFPFAVAIETEERRKVEELLVQALQSLDDPELAGAYFPMPGSESIVDKPGGMQPHEQSALEADGFLFGKSEWREGARGRKLLLCAQVVAKATLPPPSPAHLVAHAPCPIG
jgi:hypothetical protein